MSPAAVAFLANPRWKVLRGVYGVSGDDLAAIANRWPMLPWKALGPSSLTVESWGVIDRLLPDLAKLDLAASRRAAPAPG